MRKTIRYCSTFYGRFALLSALVCLCGMLLSWEYGTDIFVGVFWLKLITMALTIYHINTNRGAWFYYYHNLGISRRLLWTATMGFDFSLYLILIILVNHFR